MVLLPREFGDVVGIMIATEFRNWSNWGVMRLVSVQVTMLVKVKTEHMK